MGGAGQGPRGLARHLLAHLGPVSSSSNERASAGEPQSPRQHSESIIGWRVAFSPNHVHPGPQTGTLFGNRVFSDIPVIH